jgi:3-hydroxybutyryl-CoA dehydratase
MTEYRWSDIVLGLEAEFTASFTLQMVRFFAEISGDYNILHVDADYARAQGYKDVVVFGMMTASLYSRLVGMYLPGKFALLQGIDVDFNDACHPGDELFVKGAVSFISDAYQRFEIRARIRRLSDNKLLSKATIRVGFHDS